MNDDEITLSEMLEDPIFHQLLAADGIPIAEFKSFIALEVDRRSEASALRAQELERTHPVHIDPVVAVQLNVPGKADVQHLQSLWPSFINFGWPRFHLAHPARSTTLALDLRI